MSATLDEADRAIINGLQGGFPIAERPFRMVAEQLGLTEDTLIARIRRLREDGIISRFGPLFDSERLGGAVTLAALAVPEDRFAAVTELVNAYPEIAHNYRRSHAYNMWFVVAADSEGRIDDVLAEIAERTALPLINLPKQEEYFLELKLAV